MRPGPRLGQGGLVLLIGLGWLSLLAGCARPALAPASGDPAPAPVVDTSIRLPMRLVKNIPMVPVKINGQGPFWFTVDTGSGFPVGISRRLAARLGLSASGSILASAGGRHKRLQVTRVDSLKLGLAVFDGQSAIVLDSADFRQALGQDFAGILGYPLFREWLLCLDYPRRQVVLDIGILPLADGQQYLSLVPSSDRTPGIVVRTARHRIPIMLDSANSMGLTLYTRLAGGLALASPPRSGPRSTTLTGRVTAQVSRLDGSLFIGDHRVRQPRVYLLDNHASIGGALLRRFRVTFDQQSGVVRFERPPR